MFAQSQFLSSDQNNKSKLRWPTSFLEGVVEAERQSVSVDHVFTLRRVEGETVSDVVILRKSKAR